MISVRLGLDHCVSKLDTCNFRQRRKLDLTPCTHACETSVSCVLKFSSCTTLTTAGIIMCACACVHVCHFEILLQISPVSKFRSCKCYVYRRAAAAVNAYFCPSMRHMCCTCTILVALYEWKFSVGCLLSCIVDLIRPSAAALSSTVLTASDHRQQLNNGNVALTVQLAAAAP